MFLYALIVSLRYKYEIMCATDVHVECRFRRLYHFNKKKNMKKNSIS